MDEAKKLGTKLEDIDRTLAEKEKVLEEAGATMDSDLIDEEGYPIAGLDIYLIKKTRQEINCLRNDRKAMMNQMQELLTQLHAEKSSAAGVAMETDGVMPVQHPESHRTSNDPIARIDSVTDGSAAQRAGIKVDDLVVQFGTLHAANFKGLHQLRDVLAEGKPFRVTVYRASSTPHVHRLEVTPTIGPDGRTPTIGCQFTTSIDKKD